MTKPETGEDSPVSGFGSLLYCGLPSHYGYIIAHNQYLHKYKNIQEYLHKFVHSAILTYLHKCDII